MPVPTSLDVERKMNTSDVPRLSDSVSTNLERVVRSLKQYWNPSKCILELPRDIYTQLFEHLQYSPDYLENTGDANSLSLLDVKVFLHMVVYCTVTRSSKQTSTGQPYRSALSAIDADQVTNEWQRTWWRATWAVTHNLAKQEDKITVKEGLEVLRLTCTHIPEIPLLASVVMMLEREAKQIGNLWNLDNKSIAASDYAQRYWDSVSTIRTDPDCVFYAGLPPLTKSRKDALMNLAKYYRAQNLFLHRKIGESLSTLEQLQSAEAFFAIGQIYKKDASEVGDTTQMGLSRKYDLLQKARSAFSASFSKIKTRGSNLLNENEIDEALRDVERMLENSEITENSERSFLDDTVDGIARNNFSRHSRGGNVSAIEHIGVADNNMSSRTVNETVDVAMQCLSQSHQTLIRSICDRDEKFPSSLQTMTDQLKELNLTVRNLSEELRSGVKTITEELKGLKTEMTACRDVIQASQEYTRNRSALDDVTSYQQRPPSHAAVISQFQQPSFVPIVRYQNQQPELPNVYSNPAPPPFCIGQQPNWNQFSDTFPFYVAQQQPHAPAAAPPVQPPFPLGQSCNVKNQSESTPMPSLPLASSNTGRVTGPSTIFPLPATTTAQSLFGMGSASPSQPPAAVTTKSFIASSTVSTTSSPIFTAKPSTSVASNSVFSMKLSAEPAKPATTASPSTSSIFSGFPTTFTSTPAPARQQKKSETEDDGGGADAPFEPTAEFVPVIPLPPEIEKQTLEENEEILFSRRARLYRYDAESKQFKERGIGDLKILRDNMSKHVRVLMRREQIFKICANHRILCGMELRPLQKSDRGYTWNCQDFADGEVKTETLAVRFKEVADALNFKEIFESSVNADCKLEPQNQAQPKLSQPSTAPKSVESSSNAPKSPQPSTASKTVEPASNAPPPFEQFKQKPGWDCSACYSRNDPPRTTCVCCDAPKPGAVSISGAAPATTVSSNTATASNKVSSAAANPPPFSNFKPKPGSWSCKDCYASNDSLWDKCACCSAPKPGTTAAPANAPLPSVLNFGTPSTTSNSSKPMFGFGANSGGGLSFAALAKDTSTGSAFQKGDTFAGFGGQENRLFAKFVNPPEQNTSKKPDESEDAGADVPFESTAEFTPVIPLPDLIEVKSGEEDEEVIFSERARLFRFDPATKEFKERGIGTLKILKHREKARYRILMRREQVLKLCANHFINAVMKLLPMQKQDTAFTWQCQDFSEGELKDELLAVKFKNKELATTFKEKFEQCVAELSDSESNATSPSKENVPAPKVTSGQPGTFSFGLDTTATSTVSKSPVQQPASKEQTNRTSAFGLPSTFDVQTPPKTGPQQDVASFSFKMPSMSPAKPTETAPTAPGLFSGFTFGLSAPQPVSKPPSLTGANAQEDEIRVIQETQPSAEEKQLIDKYKLPVSFYKHSQCSGCVGCASDEQQDQVFHTLDDCARNAELENEEYGEYEDEAEAEAEADGDHKAYHGSESASSEDQIPLFTRPATLSIKSGNDYQLVTSGEVSILLDEDVDGYRIQFFGGDSENLELNHIIVQGYRLQIISGPTGHFAEWTAVDFADGTPNKRTFRLMFSSKSALSEFKQYFDEGVRMAVENRIEEFRDEDEFTTRMAPDVVRALQEQEYS